MRRLFLAFALVLAVAAPAQAKKHATAPAPHGQSFVAAANPLAAKAGMAVLERGGTAADAAVAVQSVLGLVEPQSSGLGGGAFMTFYDGKTHEISAYNGRETAPRGATPDMFMGADGKPLSFSRAVVSGRATGVPGAIALLYRAHAEHGRLKWSSLFGDGEALAEHGFKVSPRLSRMIHATWPQSARPDVIAYFHKPDGALYEVGDVLKNPAYADSLRKIAAEGPKAILDGSLTGAIIAKTHQEPLAGTLTAADFRRYRVEKSKALCRPFRVYVLCVPGPPSSGVNLLEAMLILEQTDIAKRGPKDPKAWLEIAEAERLIYADRDQHVGDPDFVSVPVEGLLDPAYVKARAALIGDRAGPPPAAGQPRGAGVRAVDHTTEPGGTSHIVIVDRWGNAVSMTTTVESIFGTGGMVGGFFLNNQLTDFSFSPMDPQGQPAANAVAPGKRPRSSMTPVIILDRQGRLVGAVGSPGGSNILSYNVKTLVAVLDWGMPMQQAINLPNLIARGSSFGGEPERFDPKTLAALRALGVDVTPGQGEDSGIQGVILRGGKFDGGADPRREGVALVR